MRKFISLRAFIVSIKNSLRFEISEVCTEVSFTPSEVMWTLMMKLPHTKVKFYPKVKSQTGLSSLRVSCKRAFRFVSMLIMQKKGVFTTQLNIYDGAFCKNSLTGSQIHLSYSSTDLNNLSFVFFLLPGKDSPLQSHIHSKPTTKPLEKSVIYIQS